MFHASSEFASKHHGEREDTLNFISCLVFLPELPLVLWALGQCPQGVVGGDGARASATAAFPG